MTAPKHTPRPWRIVIDDDGNPLSGRPSIQASEELDCAIIHWDGFVQQYWRSARGDKEILANARLIAAAPDLLAICRAIESHCRVEAPETRGNSASHAAEGRALRAKLISVISMAENGT